MSSEKTLQFYLVCCGDNDRDRKRLEEMCKKVFEEHEKHPEQRMEIIILGGK